MSEAGEGFDCSQCGKRVQGASADQRAWCKECRGEVVRTSGAWALLPALVVAAAYFYMLDYFGLYRSNFVIVFIALGLAIAWVAFKIARRVLFDVIRGRRVRVRQPHR
ncbi:MAG TPA: hypothetical protein VJT67_01820 [Longimicrobiaceae bacterium]|nr:hypothetical protein [Longimicrobiaceae bacterium]